MRKGRNLNERICAVVLALAMFLGSVLPNMTFVAHAAEAEHEITFRVIEKLNAGQPNEADMPLSGATVEVSGGDSAISAKTNADGMATVSGTFDDAAAYTYVVKKDGYTVSPSNTLDITATGAISVEMKMADIQTSVNSVELNLDNTDEKTATVKIADAIENNSNLEPGYTWKTENADIAEVSDGTITAVSRGAATIIVSRNGKSKAIPVTVKEELAGMTISVVPETDSQDITTDVKAVSITVSGMESATGYVQIYKSGETDPIGTISSPYDSALVYDKADALKGKVIFTAKYVPADTDYYFAKEVSTDELTYKKSCNLALTDESREVTYGDASPIQIVAASDTVMKRTLSYASEREDVATVDKDGNVTIVGAGTTVITVTAAENDEYTRSEAKYTVNVKKKAVTVLLNQVTWGEAKKVYDGSKSIELTGTYVTGSDTITIPVTAELDTADASDTEYTEAVITNIGKYAMENPNYDITLQNFENAELSGLKIEVARRTLYVRVKEETAVTIPYGKTNDEIEDIIKKEAEIVLIDNTGALEKDKDSGLVSEDTADIGGAVEVQLKDKATQTYYVKEYADALQPGIIDGKEKIGNNYKLAVADPVEDYSGKLVVIQETITDIFSMIQVDDGQEGVYKTADKTWVRNNTSLKVSSLVDRYSDVYMKRNSDGAYQKNIIQLSTEEEGNKEVDDIHVYLSEQGDINNATRTEETTIPAGKIAIDNKVPDVQFTSLDLFGNTAQLMGNLLYKKFTGQEYTENIIISDDGSGLAQDESGQETYAYKFYNVKESTENTNEAIKAAAVSEEGWKNGTSKEIPVAASEQGYFVLLVKVRDQVGNEAVYASNGLVIDTTVPTVIITGIDGTKAYKSNMNYTITVADTLSGIDKIEVKVLDKAGNEIAGDEQKHYNTFTVENIVDSEGNGLTKEGLQGKTDPYTINAVILANSTNNAGSVVKVIAYDKAGNESAEAEAKINVDTTRPEVTYFYDNNTCEIVEGKNYFTGNRIMTITYKERNFDPSKAEFKINVDGKVYQTNLNEKEWNDELGAMGVKLLSVVDSQSDVKDGYTDDRTITYQIEFGAEEKEYEYEIEEMTIVDLAGNNVEIKPTEGIFVIDRKSPEIEVSYDLTDDDAENGNFFNAVRTMTVTYTETYFKEENVSLKLKKDAEKTLKEWMEDSSEEGIAIEKLDVEDNKHGYKVTFGRFEGENKDFDFEISTSMKDYAGNSNQEVNYQKGVENSKSSFTVDMVEPQVVVELSDGAKNDSYYQEDCKVTVTYTERNFDEDGLTYDITIGKKEGTYTHKELKELEEISVTEDSSSGNSHEYVITFTGGALKDQDYKIKPHITDKAGNKEEETSEKSFTVDKKKPEIAVEYYVGEVKEENKKDPTTNEKERLFTNEKVFVVVTITERNFSKFEEFVNNPKQMTADFNENREPSSGHNTQANIVGSQGWSKGEKLDSWQQTFEFDVLQNGDSDFDFNLKYADLAGNEVQSEQYYLTVDKKAPEIKVTYYEDYEEDNKTPVKNADVMDKGERLYRQKKVYAKYEITERNFARANSKTNSKTFEKNQMQVKYVHTEEHEGTPINYDILAEVAGNWKYDEADKTWNQIFEFNAEANYTIGMTYTDLAGNKFEYGDHMFTVDWTVPEGTITIPDIPDRDASKGGSWSKLWNVIYNFFTNKTHTSTMESSDETSGVDKVSYYIDETVSALNGEHQHLALDELKEKKWIPYENGITVKPDSQSALYGKIIDKAGNVTYLNAKYGIIADDEEPVVKLTDNIEKSPIRNGLHNSDAYIEVQVEEPLVNGVYAGIKEVKYEIEATTNLPERAYEEGIVDMTYTNGKGERNRIGSGTIKVNARTFNSNDVTVTVTAEDNAGNLHKEYIKLSIDVTPPEVRFEPVPASSAHGEFYNVTRTIKVTIQERNFDPNAINWDIINYEGSRPTPRFISSENSNSDESKTVYEVTFSADGVYSLSMDCQDLAGNQSNTATEGRFVIDKTAPTINVTFDNNHAQNGKYYNAARTATITVNEHNFNGSEVRTAITSNTSTPSVRGWGGSGDIHTATVPFTTDGNYSFNVNYTDLAGNPAQVYNVNEFVIDLTKPEIEIFDIMDKSANNGEVAPGVRYSDTNHDVNGVSITYSGAKHAEKAVDGARSSIPNGESIKMADFEHTPETDDVYTMVAKVTDLAGNSDEKQVTFSVNRFGSNFIFSDETEAFLDDYYNNEEENLVVTEINVDTLMHRGISCGHDGDLEDMEEGTDYTVKESGGEASWKEYVYTINKENFEKEGLYNLTIDSVDRATNQVNNKIKEANIEFVIDKTAPTVVITGIEDDGQYRTNERDITIAAEDNVAMDRVEVYVNDDKKPIETYDAKMIREQKGDLPYTLKSSSDWQDIKAVAVDMAGNVADTARAEGSKQEKWMSVLVTSNVLVQFYRNTPLVIGTGIVLVGLAGIFFLIFAKRRKKDEEAAE